MNITNPSVVFFGSGPVAAESLRLLQMHTEVEAVVTKPTTVKEMASIVKGARVHSVNSSSQLDELILSDQFNSKLGVLIDFGIIVSKKVIDSFDLGVINSHFSILPEWRGADPITFSILSGQKVTGVSLMMIVEAMDEGPLVSYGEQLLDGTETGPSLTAQLIKLSDTLLQHDLPLIFLGEFRGGAPQSITKRLVSYSRKLKKEDGVLDFTKSAKQLEAEIRAFLDWPKSRTSIAGKDVVITKATVSSRNSTAEIGKVYKTLNNKIGIHCQKDDLIIEELKPAGKRNMDSRAFLAGNKI